MSANNNNNVDIQSFLESIAANESSLVASFLSSGVDVNRVSPHNLWSGNALAIAVESSVDDAIVSMLLDAHANVAAVDEQGNTALHIAIQRGNARHATLLLNADRAVLSIANNARDTPLHLAAKCLDDALFRLCLLHDHTGVRRRVGALSRTVLHVAATNTNAAVTAMLLDALHPDAVNAVDRFGQTPLHVAVVSDNFAVVKLLVDAGARFDLLDSDRRSPLHLAADRDDVRVVQLLLAAGAELNVNTHDRFGRSPLHRAAKLANEAVIVSLLDAVRGAGPVLNAACDLRQTPCHVAASNTNEKVLQALVDAGCDVNAVDGAGRTPAIIAARNSNERVIARLVAAGCNGKHASKNFKLACLAAAANENENVIGVLIAAGIDADVASAACLTAASNFNEKVLEALIASGADFRAADGELATAAHMAAANPNERVVATLIKAGAKFDACNQRGVAPLHIAVANSNARVAALILATEDGASTINQPNHDGRTPVFFALSDERVTTVEMLICAGVDLDVRDAYGMTPLAMTVGTNEEMIVLLVAGGADVNEADAGWRGLERAAFRRNTRIAALLLAAGVKLDGARNRWLAQVWPQFAVNTVEIDDGRRRVAATQTRLVRRRAADVVIGLQPLGLDALRMCEILLFACGPLARAVPFHKLWAIAVAAKHFRDSR
jgi:ankyrin repeat protein